MKATVKTVNAAGLEEIRAFLIANARDGEKLYAEDLPTVRDMLRAWAADAEFSLAEGNEATIEIKAYQSVHGHTQTFTVSDAGLDTEFVEIDE